MEVRVGAGAYVCGEETALLDSIVRAKPSAAKGKYLRSITVSSTMGPGVRIDETRVEAAAKR